MACVAFSAPSRGSLRPLSLAGALGAVALFVGCVKTNDDVTVKSDGSGQFTETISIDVAAMEQLKDMMKNFAPMMPGTPPPPAPGATPTPPAGEPKKPAQDPMERLKERWKGIPGLEVTKATSETKDGRSNISIEATFKTLEAYVQASALDFGGELTKADDGSYTLKFDRRFGPPGGRMGGMRGGPAMGDAPPGAPGAPGMEGDAPPPPAMGDEPPGGPMGGMGALAGMMPMYEKVLAGLELSRTLRLPGTIVATNGKKSDDSTSVSWKVTFDDLKNQSIEPQTVTFKGEGIDWKPFKVKSARRGGGLFGPGAGPGGPGGPPAPPGAPPPTTPTSPGGEGK